MLIYEKKLKKPIREVVKTESQDQQAAAGTAEEEKVIQVNYSNVETYIPDWIHEKILKDNTEFVIDRQVFNT